MRIGLENKLSRLEKREPSSWRGFIGRPAVEWSDEALSVLCDDEGTFDGDSLTDAEREQLDVTFGSVDCEAAE